MPDFSELYASYFPMVQRLCSAKFKQAGLAAEIAQEAFARALENLDNLKDENKFLSWVTSIAINYGRTILRRNRLGYNALPFSDVPEQAGGSSGPDNFDRLEEVRFVRRWILARSPADQQLLLMKFYCLMSDREISGQTKRTPGSIKRRLGQLKLMLAEAMSADG